ncbi:MAG: PaaI family thioesterase [Clostridiales bacterium]|nr:PaaI family thioesterase [Clostridiales bacterium]
MDYLTKAKEIFSKDIFAYETTGIEIEAAEPGHSKVSLKIEKKHLNALNNVMGGAIFTMADYAFAIASNIGGEIVVTINSQISYLGAAKGSVLYAEAKPIKSGRSTCVYNIDVTDDLGTQIACVSVTGFVKSK